MARCMPELEAYFHYRNLDVSTIKELARRWYPNLKSFGKTSAHLALQDIRDSIEELRFYRERLFVVAGSAGASMPFHTSIGTLGSLPHSDQAPG